MIRRPAEEPEPTRLLEEALGGPWAAWDLLSPRGEEVVRKAFRENAARVYRL